MIPLGLLQRGWLGLLLLQPFFVGCGEQAANKHRDWRLVSVSAKGQILSLPPGFGANLDSYDKSKDAKTLGGYSGVNSFVCILATENGQGRTKGPVKSTRRGGSPQFMELEGLIQKVLDDSVIVQKDDSLTFQREDTILTFSSSTQ